MGNCSSTSNCNPCGPNYDAINLLANKTASYARQANTSAVDAANSATDAENYWKEFNALYLGSFASAPTVDNEGNTLQEGALYFNSVSNQMFVWQGASWIDFDFDEFTPFLATGTTTARNLVTREADFINVKDFGAVGDGVTDDTASIQSAQNTGKMLWVPDSNASYYLPSPITNTKAAYFPEPTLLWKYFTSNGNLVWKRNFFTDSTNGSSVWRFRDRVMVGDAADYSGNRLGSNNYGNTWIIDKGASYLVKNATMAVAAPESDEFGSRRYGIIGFSKSMGVGAVAVNDGANTFARALYAEGFHQNISGGATTGIEIQMGNYTSNFPSANAYNMSNIQTSGLNIGAESGVGYETGNSNTPITPATNPCGCAIDISGGSLFASYQKWVTGIVFRSGALYPELVTGRSVAISMAYRHELTWGIGQSAPRISYIRSENTNALTPIGIILGNNTISILGSGEAKVAEFVDTRAGAVDAVNYLRLFNSQTNAPPQIVAAGNDTNIDLTLTPKGTGVVRFGTIAASADAPITGYIEIKDATGSIRKLAVIS
jgi:hypothetical protein